MADIFDELIGPAGASPQDLISALRRQRNLGQIGALSGDKSIARLGGSQYDDSIKQATDIRDRRDRASAQAEQRALMQQQYAEANADRDAQREYQYAALKQAGQLSREQMRNALEVAGLRESRDNDKAQAAAKKARDQQLNKLEAAMRTSGVARVWGAMGDAKSVVDEYTVRDKQGNVVGYKGVPGVGGLTNNRTWGIGTAATALGNWGKEEDGTSTATKGKLNQAKIAALQNLELAARSGMAVTDPELQRMLAETGLTSMSSDEDFLRAFPLLLRKTEESVRNVLAGYDPEVVDEYLRRGALPGFQGPAASPESEIEGIIYKDRR